MRSNAPRSRALKSPARRLGSARRLGLARHLGQASRLRRRAARLTCFVTVAAIGIGGLTLAQNWASAPQAEAATFRNDWKGVFTRDQLWIKPGLDNASMRAVDKPWNVSSINSTTAPVWFEPAGTADGLRGDSADTIAVGPVFKHEGDNKLHMVDIEGGQQEGSWIYVYNGDESDPKLDGHRLGPAPLCGAPNDWEWSAEVNQKNGYLYAITGGSQPTVAANNSTTLQNIGPRILKVNRSGSTFSYSCVAGVAGTAIKSLSGTSVSAQWTAMTGESVNVNWLAGSDMAIDALGNIYLMLTASGNGARRHGLLRINVPQDASGDPTSSGWTFELVRAFTANVTNSSVWGMAFMNGSLYTAHENNSYYRWDTLSGQVTDLGAAFDPVDLASAQMAPVISGTVYNDADGDGDVTGDKGLSGVIVEIWQGDAGANSTSWTKKGEVVTNDSGSYSALLPSSDAEFLVRVKRPKINGAQALQTYASAGDFTWAGATNTLRPYCASPDASYLARTTSGACHGARLDGVDALDGAGDPLAATGGAAIISRVDMSTDLAVVRADFGVSIAGSWGDAPLAQTTNAQGGPQANPRRAGADYLMLGATAGLHPDGQNHVEA
ncbi:MAG: hypothetical protein LBO20_03525, partial [Bifidobacteriaceae bacterium]|nr:hypothetical protein [Bifidobacteriaceae bacterium]